MLGTRLAEAGLVPDPLIRIAIGRLLRQRVRDLAAGAAQADAERAFRNEMAQSPITIHADAANAQHYEVPAEYFRQVLGPRLKYSCGLWLEDGASLADSEEAMLALTCERAQLENGQRILDLGCGWGSLSLFIAERFPDCQVLGVSNSTSQREFILARAAERRLDNVDIATCDIASFSPSQTFDRVVSVEMFEHVRNHELLLSRIAGWLEPTGKLFVHHFSHHARSYPFETDGPNDWMGRHFFTGGIMPSHNLLLHHDRALRTSARWRVGGLHYQRTCEAWLERHDANREALIPLLAEGGDRKEGARAFHRWRLFYLACAELFGYRGGEEWWVTHALLEKRGVVS